MNVRTAQVITDTQDLRITMIAGDTGSVIVSFTGIGFGLGGLQRDEFARTVNSQTQTDATIFITDKRRSWYNLTYIQILEQLDKLLANFDDIITLGNSMGGFGALYFSGLLPRCRRAIAFVPQFSVMPDIPEPRWKEWRLLVDDWPVMNALENISDLSPAVVLFGDNDVHDRWHVNQMRPRLAPPHGLFVLPGSGHEVVVSMKSRGLLSPFIAKTREGASAEELRRMLTTAGM